MSQEKPREIEGPSFNRRSLLRVAASTAGAVVVALLGPPWAARRALAAPVSPAPGTSDPVTESSAGSGHIDDACGHWPPYSHPIPYGHVAPATTLWDLGEPIDRMFMS
jgi:hypothetical protein